MPDTTTRTREQILEQYGDLFTGAPDQELEEFIASQVAADKAYAAAGEPPACPMWCVYEPGHRYESIENDELTVSRFHASHAGGLGAVVQQENNKAGHIWSGAILLQFYGLEREQDIVDSLVFRQVARDALAIADRYDELVAAEQP